MTLEELLESFAPWDAGRIEDARGTPELAAAIGRLPADPESYLELVRGFVASLPPKFWDDATDEAAFRRQRFEEALRELLHVDGRTLPALLELIDWSARQPDDVDSGVNALAGIAEWLRTEPELPALSALLARLRAFAADPRLAGNAALAVRVVRQWRRPIPVDPGSAKGRVRAPASKSVTNRALLLAAQAEGETVLVGASGSEDSILLRRALGALGVEISEHPWGTLRITSGEAPPSSEGALSIEIGNAGTTVRFLLPLLALRPGVFEVDGTARMRERPLAPLLAAIRTLGGEVRSLGREGHLPVRVRGNSLRGGRVRIDASESSQFLSALLLIAPSLPEPLEVELDGALASPSYVALTEQLLSAFGVRVGRTGGRFRIEPAPLVARTLELESDWSGATYLVAAGVLGGGPVEIDGLSRQSQQGDAQFLDWVQRMGAKGAWDGDRLRISAGKTLRGIAVDAGSAPDAVPTLAAVAAFAEGETIVSGAPHLRSKESDRIAGVAEAVRALGAVAEEREDGLRIVGQPSLRKRDDDVLIHTHDDHRLAMAFAVAALARPGVRIENPACVSKSYPEFWDDLDSLRVR